MRRAFVLSLLMVAASFATAFAASPVRVSYVDGSVQVVLDGSFTGSYYSVSRSVASGTDYHVITNGTVLCLGECSARDVSAVPGATYFYRFDLAFSDGTAASFGPYAVSIPNSPVARISPNPFRGDTRVTLSLPGGSSLGPVDAEARILDLQGRTVRVLVHGPLARGTTTLNWDGRGDNGRPLGAGVYFLRVSTPLGSSTARVFRLR